MTLFDKITQSPETLAKFIDEIVDESDPAKRYCRKYPDLIETDEDGDCIAENCRDCLIAYLTEEVEDDLEPDESCESCSLDWLYDKPAVDLDELRQEVNSRP